jgi:DNA-binding beta-propeller fold protein YncE
MTTLFTRRTSAAALVAASALLLTACATTPAAAPSDPAPSSGDGSRVALTYDGGIYVLDGTSLEPVSDLPLEGFNRLNPAGDGRHVLVSTTEGFRVLDTAGDTELTDLVFDAPTPGHVVRHDGRTILFSDGTGDSIIFDTDAINSDELPETEVVPSEAAHHGVAIELEDGTLLSTLGTSDSRTGVRALDASRDEFARSEDCPSVHGEGAAQNEVAVFGCSDGVLVYDDGAFTKIQAADAYGRTGNQYVSETSPITVGDYNSDPDSEGYLLSQLVLTDTEALESTVVDLPDGIEYTWRGVARDADDNAVILGSDGALHVLDVATGGIVSSTPVIDPWESPVEWQDAHPALIVVGSTAYVTDTAANSLHAVDLTSGEIVASVELDETPNEIAVVTG